MKKENRHIFALSLIAIASFTLSCHSKTESQQITLTPVVNTSPSIEYSPSVVPTLKTKLYSSIRSIDFKNFTFPWTKDHGTPDYFTLKDGNKYMVGGESGSHLQLVEYGDVTNDKQEEALISISPETGGNCQCYMVYVYTLESGKPKSLWNFDTWDKAEGGFKRAYAENGDLVVELFGDDKFVNNEWVLNIPEGKFDGLCCPTAFTRIRFHWNGNKFVSTGKPEMFDYDWKKHPNGK